MNALLSHTNTTDEIFLGYLSNKKNKELIEYYTKFPAKINSKIAYSQWLLEYVIADENIELFDWLITQKINTQMGLAGLQVAILKQNPYFLEKLLELGFDPGKKYKTTSYSAISRFTDSVVNKSIIVSKFSKHVELLAKYGTEPDSEKALLAALGIFVSFGHTNLFKEILKVRPEFIAAKGSQNKNLLELALSQGTSESVKFFIEETDLDVQEKRLVHHFLTFGKDIDAVMLAMHTFLSKEEQEEFAWFSLAYIQGGLERLVRLLDAGIPITDKFLQDSRIQQSATLFMATTRADEFMEKGLSIGLEMFVTPEVSKTFLF